MITHYIIMSSAYSIGKRIAIDYPIKKDISTEELKGKLNNIISKCGKDVSLSTHLIQTESQDFESVIEKDYFFKDVQLISSIEEFIELIQKDRELIGLDIAKYILCKVKCTYIKLEKLVSMCFIEYLNETGKELFQDYMYTYKYGTVVASVYEKYNDYGDKYIDSKRTFEMPAKSRILFAREGVIKFKSIEKTINKYGGFTEEKLVEITNSACILLNKTGVEVFKNKTSENDITKKYHINEM